MKEKHILYFCNKNNCAFMETSHEIKDVTSSKIITHLINQLRGKNYKNNK